MDGWEAHATNDPGKGALLHHNHQFCSAFFAKGHFWYGRCGTSCRATFRHPTKVVSGQLGVDSG